MSEPEYRRGSERAPQLTKGPRVVEYPRTGFGVAGLVAGILGVVFIWVPTFALIMSVLAVLFGSLAVRQVRKKTRRGGGVAAAGLILGIVGLLMITALLIIGAIVS